ncbi:MAG: hypothetical protein B7Z20_12810, partial [Sphingobium sp. 32-64-5]
MLNWFETEAPIRTKFKTLLLIHCLWATVALSGIVLASLLSLLVGLGVGLLALAGHALTVHVAGRLICDPYVNTVVRMEGLAAGDIHSPVLYSEYQDCVGRMTRAMEVFRDNAMRASSAEETALIVAAVGDALADLAGGDLTRRIERGFPASYESLRASFNAASERLKQIVTQVTDAAQHVVGGAEEIRSASDDLSRRTELQAASLEETSAAMKQAISPFMSTAPRP